VKRQGHLRLVKPGDSAQHPLETFHKQVFQAQYQLTEAVSHLRERLNTEGAIDNAFQDAIAALGTLLTQTLDRAYDERALKWK